MAIKNAETLQTVRQNTARLKEIIAGQASAPAPPEPQALRRNPPTVPLPSETAQSPAVVPASKPRRPNPLTAIQGHLEHPTGRVARLLARTQDLAQLNRIFRAYLPPHLRDHAILVRLDAESWVVQTDSSAWATRLRYALPSIRQLLSEQLGFEAPKPHIRIAPPAVPPPPPPPPRPMLVTQKTIDVLEGAAKNLDDPRLGAAMQRLADHAKARASQQKKRENPPAGSPFFKGGSRTPP